MGSVTPLLDILSTHLPTTISSAELSLQSRSTVEVILSFALGGDCPTHLLHARQEWSRTQPAALKALRDSLETRGAKRPRENQGTDGDANDPKRKKTAQDDLDDPPLFTLPAVSVTSPIRKKVDVTAHARSIRFTNPGTCALEASIPLASITHSFLLPTRGKVKGHWTIVLLPAGVSDRAKASPPSAQQVIFGLDALSASKFQITSYASGASTPNSATTTTTTTTTVAKGEETATSVRKFLSYIRAPLLEPSTSVFRSACATAKSGSGAAGINAYLSAKSGTLWFFDTGILWGESKPCEFWAVSDIVAKDGIRLISATGRTCSVILSRKSDASNCSGVDNGNGDTGVVETEFSMIDGREQDPIHAWARDRKHLFGKCSAVRSASSSQTASSGSGSKEARLNHHKSGTVEGPAWDESDPDDDDFQVTSSEDLEHSTTDSNSDSDGSEGGAGSGDESSSQSSDELSEEEEEELDGAHPLLRPDAVPRPSKAAIQAALEMVADMVRNGAPDDSSDEEDELQE